MGEPAVERYRCKCDMVMDLHCPRGNFGKINIPILKPVKIWIIDNKTCPQGKSPDIRSVIAPLTSPMDQGQKFDESVSIENIREVFVFADAWQRQA